MRNLKPTERLLQLEDNLAIIKEDIKEIKESLVRISALERFCEYVKGLGVVVAISTPIISAILIHFIK